MRSLKYHVAATFLLVSLAAAAKAPYDGRYLGTGRACYGTLTINDKHVSWLTPFSRCPSMTYKLVEKGNERVTFQLNRPAAQCLYSFVSLVHHAGKGMDEGWEVMGYRDKQAYLEHKASKFESYPEHILSCYLIRDPDPTGPLDW